MSKCARAARLCVVHVWCTRDVHSHSVLDSAIKTANAHTWGGANKRMDQLFSRSSDQVTPDLANVAEVV